MYPRNLINTKALCTLNSIYRFISNVSEQYRREVRVKFARCIRHKTCLLGSYENQLLCS